MNILQVAEVTLAYSNKIPYKDRIKVTSAQEAEAVFRAAWDKDKIGFIEESKTLLLNKANQVLGIHPMSTGGVTGVVMDMRLIFLAAIKANASQVIIAHNHPSGNKNPSSADIKITKQIKEAGILLDIKLLDHLIITPEDYYSFADDGTL